MREDRAGVAYIDITTGEFSATQLQGLDIEGILRAELIRLNPAEVLHFEDDTNSKMASQVFKHPGQNGVSNIPVVKAQSWSILRLHPWMVSACEVFLLLCRLREQSFST